MLIHKRWEKLVKAPSHIGGRRRAFMEGWFLLGLIPLYIREDPRFD